MNKSILYTAVFGDDINVLDKSKENISDGCDFASFTSLKEDRFTARKMKLLPHRYFNSYKYSIWTDGNIQITQDIVPIVERYMEKGKIVVLTYPDEPHNHYREGEICVEFGKDIKENVNPQLERYRREGCPPLSTVWTGIIIRRHNDPEVIKFDELWWNEVCIGSVRDQISFPYVAWKLGVEYVTVKNEGWDGEWFKYFNHFIKEEE